MIRIPLRRIAVVAAAVTALTLAGCSADGSSDTETSTAGASDDIVIGYGDIDTLDPIQFKANSGYLVLANTLGTLTQEGFVEDDNGVLVGNNEYTPLLADSLVWNDEGTLLTITLKPDLVFSDGTPLTADDVAWSIQRTMSDAGYTGALGTYMAVADPATDIVATDDVTVEITTTERSPLVEKFLSFQAFGIVSKTLGLEEAAADDPWALDYFSQNVTASGPYMVKEWTPGTEITLEKNPEWIEPEESAPNEVKIVNIPNPDQAYLALEDREIDIALGLTPKLATEAADSEKMEVFTTPSSDLVYLGFNMTDPAFQDVRVRQALSYLVPYETLRDQVMLDYANAADGPVPFPMGTALDESGSTDAYPTDVAKAADLLAQAGVTDLDLSLAVQASDTASVETATFIQSAFEEAGVTVAIDQMTDGDYNTALGDRTLQMFIGNWYSWGEDPIYQMNFLLKSGVYTNYASYSNPEVDALLEQATFLTDESTRAELSQQAQQLAIDDAPWAFLYTRNNIVVTNENVTGITRPDDTYPRFSTMNLQL